MLLYSLRLKRRNIKASPLATKVEVKYLVMGRSIKTPETILTMFILLMV